MKIQESAENYLETILMLSLRGGGVRSVDVANELSFARPSVSVAMKQFRENGLVTVDSAGQLHLTPAGEEIASKIYERHRVLTECLIGIGVSPEAAREDACKIEHDLSQESFDRLREKWEAWRISGEVSSDK